MTKRTIELDLPDEWWARIDRLATAGKFGGCKYFIGSLLDHVQQGVYRSMAWERDWLQMVVGPEAIAAAYELEEDPAYQRDLDEPLTDEA